ncbi:MAG: flagellar brake protein [Lachnospiraceae bacterium]|nr:flagellar brake protein [Lachnospiraceae bacterium]
MVSKYILPGDKLELKEMHRAGKTSEAELKVYASKVYDILSEDRMEILMPMEQTKLILLPVDGEYEMFFYGKTGVYQCHGRIIDRYKSNNMYILVVEMITNLRKYQRRDFYRFSCALNMEDRELEEEEIANIDNREDLLAPGLPLKRSVIVDISGGGLRFVSKHAYKIGCHVYCKYHLMTEQGIKEYNLVGKVLKCQKLPNRPGEYEHRVKYVNIKPSEQEEIIKYIFAEDRKHRKHDV